MDRDAANREIIRLIEQYRSLPYLELLVLADGDAIDSQITAQGELVTLSVDVRRSGGDSVRINVSAFGNNWFKHERIDESVLVTSAKPTIEMFDAAPDTDSHRLLRNTAWMGGSYAEGPYLLGMLTQTNLFRVKTQAYFASLHAYISDKVSLRAADIFCTPTDSDVLMPYLRRLYERETDYPSFAPPDEYGPPRNDRVERGMEYLLHHLDASINEIATFLQTTEKQVLRLSVLKTARRKIDLYRERG